MPYNPAALASTIAIPSSSTPTTAPPTSTPAQETPKTEDTAAQKYLDEYDRAMQNATATGTIAPPENTFTVAPSADPLLEDLAELSYSTPAPPIDICAELGVDIAAVPYTPEDPSGWVRQLANVYWEPVLASLKHAIALSPGTPWNLLPNCTAQKTWCRYNDRTQQWEECGKDGLPRVLLGADVESIKEGKETPTRADSYRPFLGGMLGCDDDSKQLTWYCWRDHFTSGDLEALIPFPQDRIVVNHNVTAYDRRYFSCEYEQPGPSTNVYLDTRSLSIMMHGISDQADAMFKGFKNAQAEGAGVPVWVTKASRSGLKDMVEYKLGHTMNKTVREDFVKLSAAELSQRMYDADDLAITPLSVHAYWAQDVQETFELFCALFAEADARFIQHPASWVGMCLLGNMRVYLEDFDQFIAESDAEYQRVLEEEIYAVVQRQADRVLKALESTVEEKAFVELNSKVVHAKMHVKVFDAQRKSLLKELEELRASYEDVSPKLAKTALQREIAKEHRDKLKTQAKKSELSEADAKLLADLEKEVTKHSATYRKLSKQYHEKVDSPCAIAQKRLFDKEAELKEVRAKLKKLKGFVDARKKPLAKLEEERLVAANAIAPYLDWSHFSNGPREGQIKWLAELEEKSYGIGGRDAVNLFEFNWRGLPIRYERNEAHEDDKTGTWLTDEERLPHLGGGENLGSPICLDYYRFVVSGELSSPHVSQDELKALFKAVENTGQWKSYQSRYKEIYREETPWGLLTTTDALPSGTVSGRVTGKTSQVLPGKDWENRKVGDTVQERLSPGKGRVRVYEDFAAQESKFLAMLVQCWLGAEDSTEWSKAVLRGVKADKTDIHNLVADYCSDEELTVSRTAGKKLNFTSIYMCGVDKLAGTLIKHFEYPEDVAIAVATKFMEYLKGPEGIARAEFDMLNRCANLPGYRTMALGRKIPDSVDAAYCPKDFHTTRANWTIQGGCVDLLHIVTTVVWALCWEYELDAFLLLTVHDSLQYSVAPEHEEKFRKVFDFAHAVAKQCAYQGATAWARDMQGCDEIPQLWCPATDIYFEKD